MYINKKIKFFDKILTIRSGFLSKDIESSLLLNIDGTIIFVSVVISSIEDFDFLSLKVEYLERFYASGRIPCNYSKREGKSTDREILVSRLIDRSIRPMFSKGLNFDIQIVVTVVSINANINPDVIAINGVSIALFLSGLLFEPVVAIRLSYYKSYFYFNSFFGIFEKPDIDIIIAGSYNRVSMIEGLFKEINYFLLFECIKKSIKHINNIIFSILELSVYKKLCFVNYKFRFLNVYLLLKYKHFYFLYKYFFRFFSNDLFFLFYKNSILALLSKIFLDNYNKIFIFLLNLLYRDLLRYKLLSSFIRVDARKNYEVRKIAIKIGLLTNVHGSSLFSRGATQTLVSITLGTYKNSQLVECVFFSHYKNNFILHYNFPPYAVNEIGNLNSVKRREVGHGCLARKALINMIPDFENFSYVIRVVSEVLSSNGSSSMATVCGSSLALMDAGVPIKRHVGGIAMGLIKEDFSYIIISDISGKEDFLGDMDFKVTSSFLGFTSLQMDLKISGVDLFILRDILYQASIGLFHILNKMNFFISRPRKSVSDSLPKIKILKIDKSKIGSLIGKNGSVIKGLMEKYKSDIDVDDLGVVKISSFSFDCLNNLLDEINYLTFDIKVGMIFNGKIIKITQFGLFINLIYKKCGLLHFNKLEQDISFFKEGMLLKVIVSNIDFDGKIALLLV